jgi:predicted site-specific integrase-resolvase
MNIQEKVAKLSQEADQGLPQRLWLSIEDLAKASGVSIRTIRRIEADGQGPPRVKRSHKYMYRSEDVERWLAARRET